MTCAAWSATARNVSKPMPELQPVITTMRPAKSRPARTSSAVARPPGWRSAGGPPARISRVAKKKLSKTAFFKAWRQALIIVAPDTVLRWQRRRFREYWTQLSGRTRQRSPVRQRRDQGSRRSHGHREPLWGAPRIHGELLKLGIHVAERTVSRLMPKRRLPTISTSRTFLANHARDMVSLDFFTVPTAGLRVLFVLVVLAHHRRHVVHFNVTEHPTAYWTAQQIVNAFPDDTAPPYLLRDRDQVYGAPFRHRVKGMRIEEVLTAPQSPWQNPFAERLIGSIRRECLDHVLVLSERHLHRILTSYFACVPPPRTNSPLAREGRARWEARRAAGGGQARADCRSRSSSYVRRAA